MRKCALAWGCFLLGALVARSIESEPAAAAGGAGRCSSTNGDVNADGAVDLSDAVTILGHLFLGSPAELVPLCSSPSARSALPATGQAVTCAGHAGSPARACTAEGRFLDHGNGTVTDTCTGLMWQQESADVSGDGQVEFTDRTYWCEASDWCENLSFGGHDDWRLPTVLELLSIVDYGRFGPSVDQVFAAIGDQLTSSPYWSGTAVAWFPTGAWHVDFRDGSVGSCLDECSGGLLIRAVRDSNRVEK